MTTKKERLTKAFDIRDAEQAISHLYASLDAWTKLFQDNFSKFETSFWEWRDDFEERLGKLEKRK